LFIVRCLETAGMEMKKSTRYEMRDTRYENGSALILVVVLTSLLAIVGVMFVMVARVDRIATSAISENKTLDSAVEMVIARISQELVLDVPRLGQEYYDYPDEENAWLASLEPYDAEPNLLVDDYRWRQISDVTGFLADNSYDTDDVDVDPPGPRKYIQEYPEITLDTSGELDELWADADGDGVADSKWIELDDITSNKGKPIYAAIRIIDNGGMLNVNTAYKFDPTGDRDRIDGSSQTQINLAALSQRGANGTLDNAADKLQFIRCGRGSEPSGEDDIPEYERDVVWRYYQPAEGTKYTPFDISDELELRNRFLLEFEHIDTRIEEEVWDDVFTGDNYLHVPVGQNPEIKLADWFDRAQYDLSEPNATENYSYRHIGTTYNMDRIINPDGGKMLNVSKADAGLIYSAIKLALLRADLNFKNVDKIAAQTAVNLIDFSDSDSDITVYPNPDDGKTYYGFEQPCIYISELVHRFVMKPPPPGDGTIYESYAIELYKPYPEDDYPDPNEWRLRIGLSPGGPIGVPVGAKEYGIDWLASKQFYVIQNESAGAELPLIDSNAVIDNNNALVFDGGDPIELRRRIDDVNDIWITVDYIRVPRANAVVSKWLIPDFNAVALSIQRDIKRHKCIRRLWADASGAGSPTLGSTNDYTDLSSPMIQAHPENKLTNIGEIGMVFRKSAYFEIGQLDTEADVRINLADPNYHNLFQYLTVFDPTSDGIDNDGDGAVDELRSPPAAGDELKVPGRININTAPWYVIAQLPWMTDKIAQAIVAYRDKLDMDPNGPDYYRGGDSYSRKNATGIDGIREDLGFASIGELNFVICDVNDEYSMRYYTLGTEDGDDLDGFPDLTPGGSLGDGIEDDFEERDVIFARISNLVTVRSDVFTAYILVRIGADGPQKRVMAILDRSNVYTDDGRVQIVALHPVPDPR